MKVFTKAFKKLFSREQQAKGKGQSKYASNRPKVDANLSPEQLCGINPGTPPEEIREHLALLYRRHNRAASSLDETTRAEAEIMLDAIVACREKHLG